MKKRELACLDVVETSRVIDRMCCMHRDELYRPEDVQLVCMCILESFFVKESHPLGTTYVALSLFLVAIQVIEGREK